MDFLRVTSKIKLTEDKLKLLKYMIEKYSSIRFVVMNHSQDSFVYLYELNNPISDEDMETIVNFWYSKFNDEIFFELSVNEITDDRIEYMLDSLSKFMHNAMVKEKVSNGWRYGEKFSMENKTSPLLVPYEQLPDEHKVHRPDIFYKVLELISQ